MAIATSAGSSFSDCALRGAGERFVREAEKFFVRFRNRSRRGPKADTRASCSRRTCSSGADHARKPRADEDDRKPRCCHAEAEVFRRETAEVKLRLEALGVDGDRPAEQTPGTPSPGGE